MKIKSNNIALCKKKTGGGSVDIKPLTQLEERVLGVIEGIDTELPESFSTCHENPQSILVYNECTNIHSAEEERESSPSLLEETKTAPAVSSRSSSTQSRESGGAAPSLPALDLSETFAINSVKKRSSSPLRAKDCKKSKITHRCFH